MMLSISFRRFILFLLIFVGCKVLTDYKNRGNRNHKIKMTNVELTLFITQGVWRKRNMREGDGNILPLFMGSYLLF